MSVNKTNGELLLGGVPRLNLLPPSHFEKAKKSATVVTALTWILVAVFLAIAAIGVAWFVQNDKALQLDAIQQENVVLDAERNQYPEATELRRIHSNIQAIIESLPQTYDFEDLLQSSYDQLPEGSVIQSGTITVNSTFSKTLLVFDFVVQTPSFVTAAEYFKNLENVEGYVRYEYLRTELLTEPYQHALLLYVDAESYLFEGITR